MWTEERRKQFSESRKGVNNPFYGKTHSPEYSKKVGESHTGIKNKNWKYDKVSYKNLHRWVRRWLPKPDLCVKCLQVPPFDVANISGKYLRDLTDWEWYCRRCHLLSDGRMFKNLKQFNS